MHTSIGFLRHRGPLSVLALLTTATALLLVGACEPPRDRDLPRLGADLTQTTVSGISSGAYMAGQFHLAHSRIVTGAAVVAGGPYGCAESAFAGVAGAGATTLNAMKAVNGCMLNLMALWGIPDVEGLARRTEDLSRAGVIDPLDGARRGRIYLFTGTEDHIVRPAIVQAAARFYERIGVAKAQIKLIADVPAGHAFVTETSGGACGRTAAPYVADCDYDQAGDLLAHLLGPLQPKSTAPQGELKAFDQRPFLAGLTSSFMADTGTAYVPSACQQNKGCRVHVAFHGCAQNRATVGDAFVRDAGFQRWADTNRLIVLFPEATSGTGNPQGCWDWWGFTGRKYLTRDAAQIKAVRRMLDKLAES